MVGLEDLLSLVELRPEPSGAPVQVRVRCYADAAHNRWTVHDLLLLANWAAQVPHDLDGERILSALGGYCSCVDLVDKVVPAARELARRHFRHVLPRLTRTRNETWQLRDRVRGCCVWGATYRSAQEAAEHARSAQHVAAEHGVDASAVKTVGEAVLHAHDLADPVPVPRGAAARLAGCLLDPTGAAALWHAGVPPALVEAVHRQVAVDGRPLPTGFYLGAVTRRPDLRWIADTAASAPERELHEWLAWSESASDRRDPDRRASWLAAGVSRRDIAVLDAGGYCPDDVRDLASGLRRSGAGAGALLAQWVVVGCAPEVEDLLRLQSLAAPAYEHVSAAWVDRLEREAAVAGLRLNRTQLATALAVCGSAARAAFALAELRTPDPETLTEWVREQDAGSNRLTRRRTGMATRA